VLAELPALPTDFGPIGRGEQTLLDADPALEEVFQGLNAIVQAAKNRGRAAMVLITSPARADGRSTLASNLAVSLAQTHKRVLLIDADLRSPSQAKIFSIGNTTGLGTLLEADVSIPITAIHHTGTPSLDVIPAGPFTGNPSELLNSQRFTDLMGDLAERYDYVLLDSPPTVTFTDARIISASCDLTLMVVRVNQFNRRMFQIGCEGLTNVGANLCGLVLNSGETRARVERRLESETADNRRETRVLS
jgi:capsular exopolysaccharide synthesis family protein